MPDGLLFVPLQTEWLGAFRMDNLIEIPKNQIIMAFVATCIEATARKLGVGYREVYERMARVNMIDDYIYPCYETLHTESRDNIANDMIACLNNWEARS